MAGNIMTVVKPRLIRCAIYTRKSTDENLDQQFNSLDAQRESVEAYIHSQRSEGWVVVPDRYDDGGFTGANTDRPALKRLLYAVEAGKVDCVAVYKVDRFSRALVDFMSMMEILDRHQVTFVSATQPFNTTTSPGRLLLNMLFSFAQFEREMISERTRDKMRAARRKGKWIGGNLILGYDLSPQGGSLIVNKAEAKQVQQIFQLYLELGSLIPLVGEMDRRGWRMKQWATREGKQSGGARFTKTTLYNLLTHAAYIGRVKFEGKLLNGEHERIVDDATWNQVQDQLNRNGRRGGRNVRNKYGALLKGLVRCASCSAGMIHTYAQKKGKPVYRYYVCVNAHQRGWNTCQTRSVSASVLEGAVIEHLRIFAQRPEIVSEVLKRLEQIRQENIKVTPAADPSDVQESLRRFDLLWEQLTIWEQEQFVRALVREVRFDGPSQSVTIAFLSEEVREMCATPQEQFQ